MENCIKDGTACVREVAELAPLPQRIVVAEGQRMQTYLRGGEEGGTRALMELVGPVTISCVEIARGG